MKKNMGVFDRVLRTILAVVVGILYFTGQLSGAGAVVLGIIAVLFLATSIMGYCPAYRMLGVSTLRKGTRHPEA